MNRRKHNGRLIAMPAGKRKPKKKPKPKDY